MDRIEKLGIAVSEDEMDAFFANFKELADRKHEVYDDDLRRLALVEAEETGEEMFQLLSLEVTSKTGAIPIARVTLQRGDEQHEGEASGGGPIDASFRAIENIVHSGSELLLYSVNNITTGTDAQGEVTVRLRKDESVVNGQGAHTDIVIASARAYLNAVSKLVRDLSRMHPQLDHI